MAKRNRDTLKNFFRDGAMPSAREFADLIDSSLNTLEDGFDKSASNGFEITVLGKHTELLSFFRDNLSEQPLWQLRFDQHSNALQFKPLSGAATLTITPQQRVGIATAKPQSTLDVAGVLTLQGQRGYQPNGKAQIPADGQWHDISGPLQGCQAFDVMAGTGNQGSGNYALLKATALNTFNPRGWWFNFLNLKKRIRVQQAYYLNRRSKLQLRWQGLADDSYCLQLRSRTDLGSDIRISYFLTRLWFDEHMSQCWQAVDLSAGGATDGAGSEGGDNER